MLKYIMKRFEDYKFTRKVVKGTTVLPPALAQLVLRIPGRPGRTSLRLNIGSRNSLANPKTGWISNYPRLEFSCTRRPLFLVLGQ